MRINYKDQMILALLGVVLGAVLFIYGLWKSSIDIYGIGFMVISTCFLWLSDISDRIDRK